MVTPLNELDAESTSVPPPFFVSEIVPDELRMRPDIEVVPPAIESWKWLLPDALSIVPRIDRRPLVPLLDVEVVQVWVPPRRMFTIEPLVPIVTAPDVADSVRPPAPIRRVWGVEESDFSVTAFVLLNDSALIVVDVESSAVTPPVTLAELNTAVPVVDGTPDAQLPVSDHVPVRTFHVDAVWAAAGTTPRHIARAKAIEIRASFFMTSAFG